jgi:hypothetical protein
LVYVANVSGIFYICYINTKPKFIFFKSIHMTNHYKIMKALPILRNAKINLSIPALIMLVLMLTSSVGWGQPVLEENFNFTTTNLVGTNGWAQLGNAATPKIQVIDGNGLTYSGYASSGIGNAASLSTSGDDAIKSFTAQNSGTVYHSMLVNVSASQATGDYFTCGYDGTTNYTMRLYIKTSGSGFIFGMSKTTGTVTYESTVRSYNTTYLLVLGYKFVAGTLNDEGYVWVNPTIGGTEPTPTIGPITDATKADISQCIAFVLRQGSASNAATLRVDGIRVSTVWATAVAQAVAPTLIPTPNQLNGFSYLEGLGPSASQSYSLSGQYLTFPGSVTVSGSAHFEVSSDNSSFGPTASIPLTSATLDPTPVYVRLISGLTTGNYLNETVTNAGGGATTVNVTCNGAVVLPEPTNHVTNFVVGSYTPIAIPLTWTDAIDGTVPTGYLVKASATSFDAVIAPVDYAAEADGAFVKNVASGVGTITFSGLQPNTTYYFKIWPYTNSGSFIDYKLSGTVPQQSATTTALYFQSAASGAWNVAATWLISNDNSSWTPATTEVPLYRTSDVTIKSGHLVTVPTSYNIGTAKNLTVETGATLYANASSGSCFVYVYGDFLNNGTVGGATDVIGFDIESANCNLSGTGSFIAARMSKFTNANTVTNFTINQNVTLTYTTAANNALYNNVSGTTTFNIIVGAGKQLTVSPAKISLAGATLTLNSDISGTATLKDNGISGAGASSVVVQRYIGGWTDALHGWHLLSSPVAAQTIDPAFTNATPANYDFYKWDELTNMWLTQKLPANSITSFVPGTGYLVAYQSAGTKQFTGTLNTANVTASGLTISGGANSGWNLVGNPFACALKWNDGTNWIVPAEIAGTAKVWNESTAAYVDIAANGYIPAMNGFMVQVLSGSPASLTIPILAREQNSAAWYKTTEGSIKLIAYDKTGNTAQECIVGMNDQATEGYDAAYDSRFLAGYAPQFYAVSGDNSLSTTTLPDLNNGRVIEMGFVKNSASEFSIGLDGDNMIPGLVVFLTDKKTGANTELTGSNEYTFTATEGDDANRFQLHFGPLGIDDPSANANYSIYASSGNIFITSQQAGKSDVVVTNLLGQVVMHSQVNGTGMTTISAGSLQNGIYMVSVNDGNQVISRKVLINR